MSQLVLIAGFKNGTSIFEIINYIKKTFQDQTVVEFWMDPYSEPRAVVLFDKQLDLEKILKISMGESSAELSRYFDIIEPAQSVFVKTYNSLKFGVTDKLKYLFTSHKRGGSQVLNVERLRADDCYEIYFLNWDAVLKTCKHTWTIGVQTLTVTPYFEGFKEPVKQQLQRLRELNKKTKQAELLNKNNVSQDKPTSSSSAVWKLTTAPLKQLPPQPLGAENTYIQESRYSAESSIETQLENQESLQKSHPDKKADLKCAKPVFEHSYILMLLHLLNFEKAVQVIYNTVTVKIDETWEVEIKGPVSSVKIIQNMLAKEDEPYLSAHVENFLARKSVQQDLKAFIDSEKLYVDIVDVIGKPHLQVKNETKREISFHDFVSSLVITKDCFPLPSEQSKELVKWRNFTESFKNTYSHLHISVKNNHVILLSLAHKSQDIDVILSIVNNVISQLKKDAPSDKKSGTSVHDSNDNRDTISEPNNSGQSSEETFRTQLTTSSRQKSITLCPQQPLLPWILDVLKLKEAVKQYTSDLVVEIDEDEGEVIINGITKAVQNLKKVLMSEDKQFPIAEHEQELLSDVSMQQHLSSYLNESGSHIVLRDNFNMSVTNKDGEEVPFKTYVANFSMFRECSHLSEKYQTSKEWKSLVEHFKNNYPHCHILISNDKVYLFSFASGKGSLDTDSLADTINNTVSNLTSVVPTDKRGEAPNDHLSSLDCKHEDEDKMNSLHISGTSSNVKHKKVQIICQHPVLLWLLNHLNLKEAVREFGVDITIDFESGITIKGPRDIVQNLEKKLLKEDNEFPIAEHEQELLSDVSVQQHFNSYLNESGSHIVLSDNFNMSVTNNDGEEVHFRTYITSISMFRECSHLSEKYQTSKEWKSLIEHFKNTHPHYHIFVANDKVYLLSIASGRGSLDTDSLADKINKAISSLTSGMPTDKWGEAPNDHISSLDCKQEEGDKMNFQISDTSKSLKQKKVQIICQHPVLLWILNHLNLKEAVREFGVDVTIDFESGITIKGPRDIVQNLEKKLLKEDNEIPFESHEEEFLLDDQVQQHLGSCLKNKGACLVWRDSLELFVVMTLKEEKMEKPLWTFLISIIEFRECLSLPENYQTIVETKSFIEHVKKTYPHHHIFTSDDKVYLLTIVLDDKLSDVDKIVEEINRNISFWTSLAPHDSEMTDDLEQHDLFVSCTEMKMEYFTKFLEHERHNIEEKYKKYSAEVKISEKGFHIHSDLPTVNNKMREELGNIISKIITMPKEFRFPGLQTYSNSKGLELINSLSYEHNCLIKIQDTESAQPQSLPLSEEQSSESSVKPEYKVLLLGTAKCNGFNIHLIQGDIQDLNLSMTVVLQPSKEVEECKIRGHKSSQEVILELPPWSAPSKTGYDTHFEALRSSFRNKVAVALTQAKHLKQTSLAFSTANLTNAEYSFPVYVIAKEILDALFEKFESSSASKSETKTLDVYICESVNEAVFKAFKFCLKQKQIYIPAPNQACWDNICFQEPDTCPDYKNILKSKGLKIEVVTNISAAWGSKASIFYPINPSLEISTCAAVVDSNCLGSMLKSSLRDLQNENPDGLLAGDVCPLPQGFSGCRKAFIYCCPDWGMHCDKIIESTLKECIKKSAVFEEVVIIPPGMLMFSKYPMTYLAQKIFKTLDKLIIHNQHLFSKKKKIIFLVQDALYKKAFDQEMQKRYPTYKGFWQNFKDSLPFGGKENINERKLPMTVRWESSLPRTVIFFCGTRELNIQQAAQKLEKHLKEVMEENREKIQLSLSIEEADKFERQLKDLQDIHVFISCEKEYGCENKTAGKTQHKTDQKISFLRLSLKIQGLDKSYVKEFLNMAEVGRHIKDFHKLKIGGAHEETTMSLKASAKHHENNFGRENGKQFKKNSKLCDPGESSDNVQASASVQVVSYKWLHEVNSDFNDIGSIGRDISIAYKENKDSESLQGKNYTQVNFASMTVTMNNNTTRGIIRTENFEPPLSPVPFPTEWTWSSKSTKFELKPLETTMREYKEIQEKLVYLEQNNMHLVQVSQVQNKRLYTNFIQKLSQLKNKEHKMLWHKAFNNYGKLVCKYGFHPRFSGMPEAKHLGDGVLFYDNPHNCLKSQSKSDKEICLMSARVLPGRPGPGKQGLRCPPFDEATREPFDSVYEDGAYMIFSDAQAYPVYMITLQFK